MAKKRKYGVSRRVGALAAYDARTVAHTVIEAYRSAAKSTVTTPMGVTKTGLEFWSDNYARGISVRYLANRTKVETAKKKLSIWYNLLLTKGAADVRSAYKDVKSAYEAVQVVAVR
jgi:hypothetical protein